MMTKKKKKKGKEEEENNGLCIYGISSRSCFFGHHLHNLIAAPQQGRKHKKKKQFNSVFNE